MIKRCETKDIPAIKEIFRLCNISDNAKYMEHYFKKIYSCDLCINLEEDEKIVATLTRFEREIMLHGVAIQASMIENLCILPNYSNKGYREALMRVCTDAVEHQELITLLKTKDPSSYEYFGFKLIYYRNQYNISKDMFTRISTEGCIHNPNVNDMFKAYSTFVRRFDGFIIRDYDYFTHYVESIQSQGGKVCAYYDELGLIQGYAIVRIEGKKAIIEELIYSNSVTIYKLLNTVFGIRDDVVINTSMAEDISMLLNGIKPVRYGYVMARLNDADLFNRLYNTNITTIEEAMNLTGKPLYLID